MAGSNVVEPQDDQLSAILRFTFAPGSLVPLNLSTEYVLCRPTVRLRAPCQFKKLFPQSSPCHPPLGRPIGEQLCPARLFQQFFSAKQCRKVLRNTIQR